MTLMCSIIVLTELLNPFFASASEVPSSTVVPSASSMSIGD